MQRVLVSLVFLLVLVPGARADAAPKLDKKKIQTLAQAWFEARPKTQFESWKREDRKKLLNQAKALGPLPEGKLAEAVELIWKHVKKNAPKPKGSFETPLGNVTWIQKGRGGKKAGFVLGLHGGGEGAGSAGEAAGNWGVPKHMCIYPQGNLSWGDTWNTAFGERYLLTLIEIAKARYEIDPDRVYVMGFSMGGTGSWFLAGRHPDLLAGAIPAHGVLMAERVKKADPDAVGMVQHGFIPNVRNLPVYFYTGMKDVNCEPGTFRYAWRAIEQLIEDDPKGYSLVKFQLHENLAHSFPPGEPGKGIKYVTAKKRDTFPRELFWEYAEAPFPLSGSDKIKRRVKHWFYWLRCLDPRDMMQVRAKVSKSGSDNEIDLEVTGSIADDFTIYLNDQMIDVAKETVVRENGKEIYRGRPKPDFATVFDSLDARLDRSMVFDRKIDLARD